MADETVHDAPETGQDPVPPDTGSVPATTAQPEPESKSFSQAEVDKLIERRLERERRKLQGQLDTMSDYEELKAAAEKLRQIEDAQKTEQEKAAERAAKIEKQLAELQGQNARLAQERTEALIRSAVTAKATTLDFLNPADAYALIDLSQVKVGEDGTIGEIDELLTALAEQKPYLLRQAPRATLSPTNPQRGREPGETDADRRGRLFGRGDSPIGHGQGGGLVWPPRSGSVGGA